MNHSPNEGGGDLRHLFLVRGMDLAENRDYFGNYVYNPNGNLGKKLERGTKYPFPTPFVVSNYQPGVQMGEPKTAWLSAFGFPRAPSNLDFTPAERLAQSLLKAREAPTHAGRDGGLEREAAIL